MLIQFTITDIQTPMCAALGYNMVVRWYVCAKMGVAARGITANGDYFKQVECASALNDLNIPILEQAKRRNRTCKVKVLSSHDALDQG